MIAFTLRLIVSVATLLLSALALTAPAQADMLRQTQPAKITVSDQGGGGTPVTADPYPSTIDVAGAIGMVTGVTVRLNDVNHTHPDDLDLFLVGPNGRAALIMSDAGGHTDLVDTDITLDEGAAAPLPDGDPITSGSYRPADYAADTFPPATLYDLSSSSPAHAFDGSTPNGKWTLYVLDDSAGDGGEISGGWTLTLTLGERVTSQGPITIADYSAPTPASPYPSTVTVDDTYGVVKKATVTLYGFKHDDPGDVDVLLEGPTGATATLMSDAGGANDAGGLDLRFDDDATAALPEFDPLASGSYKPTNQQGPDVFPAPAPKPFDTTLDNFVGRQANGDWRLWVVDDAGGASGKLGGWSLQLTVQSGLRLEESSATTNENEGAHTLVVERPEGGGPATIHYELPGPAHAKDVKPASGDLTFALGQKSKPLPITLLDDSGDEPAEWAEVRLSAKSGDASSDPDGTLDDFKIEDDDATDVRADFNGDGRSDQAIGVPEEDLAGGTDAGAVQILYGTDDGLSAANDQRFTQDVAGVPDVAEPGDEFGAAVAASDLNGDGYGDLAIGAPGEDDGGITDMGRVTILYGSANGLKTAGALMLGQGSPGVPDGNEPGDRFGAALAAGNLGRGARGDLAIGAPGEDVGAIDGAGAVTTLYGTASGLGTAGAALWHQNVAGVEQDAEAGDAFGSVLAIADLGLGAEGDLVVGVPAENAGRGVVQVLYGTTAGGVAAAGDKLLSQSTPGMGAVAEDGDSFGAALAVGDLNRAESAHDVAIGAPGEDLPGGADAGAVHLLHGDDAGGVTAASAWNLNQATPLIGTGNGPGDRFGAALAIGDFGANSLVLRKNDQPAPSLVAASEHPGDLAIGVPGESFGGLDDVGAVQIVYGDTAPNGAEDRITRWHQDVAGIADTNEAGDKFGSSLAAGRYEGSSGDAGLSVGVPGEKAGGVSGPGGMATLYATDSSGLGATGSERWSQGVAGVQDAAEAGDAFGSVLAP
ncbi:MAG TPA: proprotein convertase P-domain-containing protein [Solirubrobacteraceae bacterium]|jgi:subtilisin-like proprotein convertase family protein